MSLDAVMRTAISGLNAQQAALRVTSNNIANVNTPGYVRQEPMFQTRVLGRVGNGVELAEVRRIVDEFLNREYIASAGNEAYYRRQSDIHDRLQTLLGAPDSESSLAALVNRSFSSIAALALEPAELPLRATAVQDLQTLGTEIDRLSRQVQALRQDADRQIGADIAAVNSALQELHELNPVIAQQKLAGQETAALEEQRQRAVEKIAEHIDIRAVEISDSSMRITTTSGLVLLDRSLRQLDYTPAGSTAVGTTFDEISIMRVDLNSGQQTATGETLYGDLRAGGLKGLIDMRDKELPEIAAMLGELSANLVDQFNAVHNASTAVPPPNSLTGRNTGLLASDAHGFTGTVTFAVLDADNAVTNSVAIDFDGGGYATLGDVITAVNAGLGGAGTLSLNDGVMTLAAANGTDGVAMLQDPNSPSERGGRGFAHFFGLNDLLSARGPAHFDTGLTSADPHGFGASGVVSMELRGPGGQVALSADLDFSAVGGADMSDVLTELNSQVSGYGSFALDGDGRLAFTPDSAYEDYALHVANDTTTRGATGATFSDLFGISASHQMNAAFDVAVDSEIRSNPSDLALAWLDLSGTPALAESDNRGALALQALESASVDFSAAGDLAAISTTLSNYSGSLLSSIAAEADRTSNLADDRAILAEEIDAQRSALSGVNLDEELANLIIFQQAYNAAARLITTTNEMYDSLLAITV